MMQTASLACCAGAQSSFRGGQPRCRDSPAIFGRSERSLAPLRDGEVEVSGEEQAGVDTYFDRDLPL
jgi:hypothetical protein